MNAQLKDVAPIVTRSEELSSRIEAERRRLAELEAAESELSANRLRLLTTAKDSDVDEVERQIDQNRGQQIRILERVELLEVELKRAREDEEIARLDEIAAAAERSRADAEKLIKSDYVKAARTLAAILARLHASDTLIEQSNRDLVKAGRPEVLSANAVRMRSRAWFEWIERKLVTAGDPHHPQHADAEWVQSGNGVAWKSKLTRQLIEPVEVEITHNDRVFAAHVEPLWQTITLPAVEPQSDPYVHANGRQLMDGKSPTPIWKATNQ